MKRNFAGGAAAAIALLLAAVLAAWGMEPPPVRDPAAASTGVRLDRMLADLRIISREPHVTGSAANERVRDHIVAQLRSFGLSTAIHSGTGVRQSPRGTRPIATAPVDNVVAILPGRDRGQPAVAVMAHYDAVPFSHGAADDGAGTAAVLETARRLAAGPMPARDVIFLLTDGEELGLLGAQFFFTEHPLAGRIGIVVNAEARGAKGRATMFQTSTGDRDLVAMWAAHAISPSGNSLAGTIYRLLPNDTDLSVPLAMNIAGINAAFTGGHFDYHSTTDRFEHVDRRSLQHLGDFTLTTTQALATAERLPGRQADAVYFDLFGLHVVQYPVWLGWVVLGLTVGGWSLLVRREEAGGPAGIVRAVATVTGVTLLGGALAHGLGMWLTGSGATDFREMMAEEATLLPILCAIMLGLFCWMRPTLSLAFGATGLLIIAALATQIWLPAGSFLFVWPALVATILLAMARRLRRNAAILVPMVLLSAGTLGLILQLTVTAWVSVGLLSAGVVALALPFMVALLGPLLQGPEADSTAAARRLSRPIGALAVAGGLAGVAAIAATDGFSTRQPRPGDFFALFDADNGRHYWASTSGPGQLPGGTSVSFSNEAFPRFRPSLIAAGALPAIDPVRMPSFTPSTTADGRHQVTIATVGPPRVLSIAIRPAAGTREICVNGQPVTANPDGWTTITYRAQKPAAITLSATVDGGAAPFAIRYMLATAGLPANAPRTAGLQTNWAILTGTQTVIGRWPAQAD